MKRIGKEPPIKDSAKVEDILSSIPADVIDAAEKDNAVELYDDPSPAFPDMSEDFPAPKQQDMSLHSPEFYEKQAGFAPAIEHPFVRPEAETKKTKVAKPAQGIDLEHLDESMIMNMPEIKASSFKIIDMLDPKPKDKGTRFRWANYKNFTAGNLGKYLAIGFQIANIDDVDEKRTPIDPSMRDGSEIKYYDVILLKINVIRLMELYKTNIIKSVNKLAKAKEKGLAEATRQFQSDISSEPGASRSYNHYKNALGKEPVEFFATE